MTTLLGFPGRDAAARFNVIGPGSTVYGDHGRGRGVAAYGQGWNNYLTPLGRAVDADTDLRLKDAAAQARAEWMIYLKARYTHRKARIRRFAWEYGFL
jgi:hypothetical protein